MTMYDRYPVAIVSLDEGKQDSRAVFAATEAYTRMVDRANSARELRADRANTTPAPHHGSIEAHARATIAQMKPEKRWRFLNQMLAEEIAARHDAYEGKP